MRVALVHYHMNPGGVTTVMRQQAALLHRAGHEVLLVIGETPPDPLPVPVAVVPGLAYDRPGVPLPEVSGPERTAGALLKTLRNRWPGQGADLIHVHNPTLGKNRCIQAVLKQLQNAGVPLLCQIHDFAEDGRPEAYLAEPYVADCHYAVVNGRDRRLLLAAGLADEGVHHLPNALEPFVCPSPIEKSFAAPVLYPVRAIRRKNIGEAILLRLLMATTAPLNITLPPRSPRDLPGYRLWQALVARHGLPVVFEAGLKSEFRQLLAACRFVLTTSITEGFGFVFLEPWSSGKALWGRRLPDICDDFGQKGLRLEHLYTHLWVPLNWLDADLLRRRWSAAWREAARRYDQPLDPDRDQQAWTRITGGGRIDFGLLDEPFQQGIIERLIARPTSRAALEELNPFLRTAGPPPDTETLVRTNREMVRRHFNPDDHLARLLSIYQRVVHHPVRQAIDKSILPAAFLAPERFSLLKWSRSNA